MKKCIKNILWIVVCFCLYSRTNCCVIDGNPTSGTDWALQVIKEKPLKGKIQSFEAKLDDAENFTTDILTKEGSVLHYNECKNYAGTVNYLASSGSNFIDQFANTLSKINSLDQMHYFFHSRYAGNLKNDVIEALSSAKGREALSGISFEKAKVLFPDDLIITNDNYVDRIISNLNKDEFFNLIFK